MNISKPISNLSEILTCISQPARIQILMGLGPHEACVCHLEALLGMTQASISQHLMILRKNGIVATRRDGRHIYYSLSNTSLLEVFQNVASIHGIEFKQIENANAPSIPGCSCPMCNPGIDQQLACKPPQRTKPKNDRKKGEQHD
jgi:DNA-binding transcriptional ArsR family regulator